MTFEVDINGRTRTVAVEKYGGGKYRVSLDGALHEVDASRVGVYGLSLLEAATGISREVQVTPGSARGELLISTGGRTLVALVNGRRTGRPAADAGAGGDGQQAVIAPMPGRVVRVLVAQGDGRCRSRSRHHRMTDGPQRRRAAAGRSGGDAETT